MSVTLANLSSYATEVITKEGGGSPNPSFVRLLINQAIRELCAAAGGYHRSWTNAADGDLTIVGNAVALPDTFRNLDDEHAIVWDATGEVRVLSSTEEMEALCGSDWRTATGSEPTYAVLLGNKLMFDCAPGTAVGSLAVYGYGYPDPVTDADETVLAEIALPDQLAPAYRVIAESPIETREKTDLEIRLQMESRERYRMRWERALQEAADSAKARTGAPYSGR